MSGILIKILHKQLLVGGFFCVSDKSNKKIVYWNQQVRSNGGNYKDAWCKSSGLIIQNSGRNLI